MIANPTALLCGRPDLPRGIEHASSESSDDVRGRQRKLNSCGTRTFDRSGIEISNLQD
jgi:hypothetical protein